MSGIQTGIQLNDQFTAVIYNIINSVNLAVSTMEDMQGVMNHDIDTSAFEGIHDEINQATMAMNELNAAMQNADVPTPDGSSVQTTTTTPVSQPITWNTDSMDVFTNTGIDRFQQEVQSTNSMLDQLNDTQIQIQQQASRTDILPDAAVQDMNAMGQRLQTIQQRIQQIESNPVNMGTDTANMELERLRSQLNLAVQEQNELNTAMQNMDVSAANNAYLRLSQTVSSTERYIRDNVDEQGRFNQEISEGVSDANNLMSTIKNAVAAYVGIQSIGKVLELSDELTQTTSRIDMMNDGMQSTDELIQKVYESAQDARGSFDGMADVVARFGNNAGDAFGSSEEVVAFANLVQKQMTIAGASTTEASNAMLQLSQGLGSGVLRGDELNSIFEQAPNLIQNIADYLEVPIGTIREMASEGQLTADIVKSAIFAASDDINAKFQAMPMTWGQIWQSFQNTATMAFRPILQRISEIANSDGFQEFANGAIEAMTILTDMVLNVFDLFGAMGSFVADNWSVLSPLIYGVIAALATYVTYLGIVKVTEIASAAATAVMSVAKGIYAAATMIATGATWAATTAQMGLNGAMYACPIVWIIIMIIALIAALVALCNWIAEVTGAANSGIGIIVGALSTAAAFIGNLFVALINMVIDIFVVLWNFIASFVNFFGNVFNDPIGSIARLFFDLVDCILGLLQTLAGAIDAIFGSDLAGAVQGWRDDLGGWVDETFGHGEEIMEEISGEDLHVSRFEYGEAWDSGVELGDGIASAIDDFSLEDIFGAGEDFPPPEDYTSQFNDMGGSLGDIAGDTSSISDAMDVTAEDLKYLRDLAEQETVNRFTTAEIKVDMTNHNNISNGMDLDGVVSGLTDAVNEAIENMTEGVHD